MSFRALFSRAGLAAAPLSCCKASARMPLKARMIGQQAAAYSSESSSQTKPHHIKSTVKELPGDEPEDVLFNNSYGLRTIELNRPKKLNSLNGSMIRKILPRMIEWEKSDMANVIVMKGAGEKALCAGGDVTALAQSNMKGPKGQERSAEYFALEYKLNHYIATYLKPYISFMDGITMGGGVGLSIHAPFRIATERTVFAMPETTIGFFPDVGASFFLPRMPGAVGTYLALTSERLTGANVLFSGVATHYLHSSTLPILEGRLAELRFKDFQDQAMRLELVRNTIQEYATGIPHDEPMLLAGELRKAIDRCFSKTNVDDILSALGREEGPTKAWAEKTLETLHKRSPTAVHVTLRQMQLGKSWSIAETFKREHQIAAKFMKHPDFTEGVRAQLMSKEKPKPAPQWKPATLADVKPDSGITEPFFETSDGPPELELLTNRDFEWYPWASFGVPGEAEIQNLVSLGHSKRDIVSRVLESRNYAEGVETVVREILARKTVSEGGKLTWNKDA